MKTGVKVAKSVVIKMLTTGLNYYGMNGYGSSANTWIRRQVKSCNSYQLITTIMEGRKEGEDSHLTWSGVTCTIEDNKLKFWLTSQYRDKNGNPLEVENHFFSIRLTSEGNIEEWT